MSPKDDYIRKLQARVQEWDKEINKLATKAIQNKSKAKLEYYKQLEELRDKQDVALKKLERFRQADDDAWEGLKAGLESIWADFSEAVKSSSSKFK
jgi:hypothetical protein